MAGKSIVNVSSVVELSAFKMIFDLLSYLIAGTVKNKHITATLLIGSYCTHLQLMFFQ